MNRRPYALLVGVAIVMGTLAVVISKTKDLPLHDPDGFLGPSWSRLPLMVLGAFAVDVIPRSLWRSRRRRGAGFLSNAREIVDEHWTRDRMTLVVVGLVSFYVTYVSYRNLKNYVVALAGNKQDQLLHRIDKAIFFGHEPAILLHNLLGDTIAAHILAYVYLLFLPLAPLSLIVFLVWSRNVTYGYWYATANCLCWALGTLSYYLVPSVGPNFEFVWLYGDLDTTGVKSLQDGLWVSRSDVIANPLSGSLQSVAGFASLHIAIILTLALLTHYTVRHRLLRVAMWIYFSLTVVSTLYFGWHYIADDVAGAAIAFFSVWLGALATGQRFDRRGRRSHPTTSRVPARK